MTAKRRFTDAGYVRVFRPDHPMAMADGYVLEHRMVAYDAGLLVERTDHVHHVNGVKDDNRVENLHVHPPSDHHRLHVPPGALIANKSGVFPVVDLSAGHRVCRECGENKPFDQFGLRAGRPHAYCKPCMVKRVRRYRLTGTTRRSLAS